MRNCFICDRILDIKQNKNPNFVAELKTGYVILLGNIRYPGYTIFSCKIHATELHELPEAFKTRYLKEMTCVAKWVWDLYKPRKLNYELLGNSENHLHWHIIPRYEDETKKLSKYPIWVVKEKDRTKLVKPEELSQLVEKMKEFIDKQIKKRGKRIIRTR